MEYAQILDLPFAYSSTEMVFVHILGGCRYRHGSPKIQIENLYEGEFYVNMHGEKYHRKVCLTIEGHEVHRLTQEDVKSGRYEFCSVRRPNQ